MQVLFAGTLRRYSCRAVMEAFATYSASTSAPEPLEHSPAGTATNELHRLERVGIQEHGEASHHNQCDLMRF
jgi:hypothetical protein